MTRLNLGSGIYTIAGRHWRNHDPILDGWHYEDGLGQYPDESIEAITESHSLMYVHPSEWPGVFAEFYRVLEPGGIVRVQEDWTNNPDSERYGGYPGFACLTTPDLVAASMSNASLVPMRVTYDTTEFHDDSLIQKLHGGEPKTFVVEGIRPSRYP